MTDLDDARWNAVLTRDGGARGIFLYGVSTTGVFCQPGCTSRRPLRKNVVFFSSLAEARGSGYRACRRCRPEEAVDTNPSLDAVIGLGRLLDRGDRDIDVAEFASQSGYSERHLRRRFSEVIGVSVAEYQRASHIDRARRSLRNAVAVGGAVYDAGFGSSRAFYEQVAPRLGMAPASYRAGAVDERISYTFVRTPLGAVLAACTRRGLCALRIGPDEAKLYGELRDEFPHAVLERDDDGLAAVSRHVEGAVRGQPDTAQLPLDLAGTAFQLRVWRALREVPLGDTATYSEIATRIGSPNASRAVGAACAANPVALVVPCHRVVRRDGSVGGYRWGVDVKERLLQIEADAREAPPTA